MDSEQLIRWYTQNIDSLEFKSHPKLKEPETSKIICLHGTLDFLVCTLCQYKTEFTTSLTKIFEDGIAPKCPTCTSTNEKRNLMGRRSVSSGFLRPNIVLYNEAHFDGEFISECVAKDCLKNPSLIVVVGTSLKIPGLLKLLKDFIKRSKLMCAENLALYINKTPLRSLSLRKLFDYELIGNSDDWCNFIDTSKTQTLNLTTKLKQKDIREFVSPLLRSGHLTMAKE